MIPEDTLHAVEAAQEDRKHTHEEWADLVSFHAMSAGHAARTGCLTEYRYQMLKVAAFAAQAVAQYDA